jgi:Cu(I)-responsive transcriptional regulator
MRSESGEEVRFNIGQAAWLSGVSATMIRHYEVIALLAPARRSTGSYRLCDERDVHSLRFIRRARTLGFSTAQIARLLSLWRNRRRASGQVRAVALEHVVELDEEIAALDSMRKTLQTLVEKCHADERPECPILDDLAPPCGNAGADR